jgi:MFS family permease
VPDPAPSSLPAPLRALAHRDYRLFFSGQLVSLVGTWMQSVAQSWLVLELTSSPFRLGLVGALQFTPMLLGSFFAGALADRVHKRRLLLATQSLLGVQALTLAVLVGLGHVQYWHVAVMATVYGIGNTLDIPARQAFVAEIVGKGELVSAIALNSAAFNGARVVGPALAGLAIARWGTAIAFALNAVSFVAVLAALLAMTNDGAPRGVSGRRMRVEIAEGIRYAVRTPRIVVVLALVLVVSVFLFNNNVTIPLLARVVLGQDAHGFGLLMAAMGAGAVTGALALATLGRGRPAVWSLLAPALVLASVTAALPLVTRFGVAAAMLAVMGFCGIVVMAGANTSHQLTVPDELRGRLMSLHTVVFAGMAPFGALFIGTLAERLGVRAMFTVTGLTGGLGVLVLGVWWQNRRRSR